MTIKQAILVGSPGSRVIKRMSRWFSGAAHVQSRAAYANAESAPDSDRLERIALLARHGYFDVAWGQVAFVPSLTWDERESLS